MTAWHITAKDLLLLSRDKRALVLLLILPLVLVVESAGAVLEAKVLDLPLAIYLDWFAFAAKCRAFARLVLENQRDSVNQQTYRAKALISALGRC